MGQLVNHTSFQSRGTVVDTRFGASFSVVTGGLLLRGSGRVNVPRRCRSRPPSLGCYARDERTTIDPTPHPPRRWSLDEDGPSRSG
jgi:hypothetical protein